MNIVPALDLRPNHPDAANDGAAEKRLLAERQAVFTLALKLRPNEDVRVGLRAIIKAARADLAAIKVPKRGHRG